MLRAVGLLGITRGNSLLITPKGVVGSFFLAELGFIHPRKKAYSAPPTADSRCAQIGPREVNQALIHLTLKSHPRAMDIPQRPSAALRVHPQPLSPNSLRETTENHPLQRRSARARPWIDPNTELIPVGDGPPIGILKLTSAHPPASWGRTLRPQCYAGRAFGIPTSESYIGESVVSRHRAFSLPHTKQSRTL
jgi:hypothetical protein